MLDGLLQLLERSEIFDLAHPYKLGMPHHPFHPPFLYSMAKRHGDYDLGEGVSSASEVIGLGGHVGAHIDALGHFSRYGKLHGGVSVEGAQSFHAGLKHHGVENIPPIVRRGVLIDAAGALGVEVLPEDFGLNSGHLEDSAAHQGTEIRPGDVVLIRTGWARYWNDPGRYINGVAAPGPNLDGALWLSGQEIFAAGSDTIAFEHVPAEAMPVHVHLLVESGIYILEALDLEQLAAHKVYEFAFIAAPLKIAGGTGAPIRPLALIPR